MSRPRHLKLSVLFVELPQGRLSLKITSSFGRWQLDRELPQLCQTDSARDLGIELFNWLLSGEVGGLWRRGLNEISKHAESSLSLCLDFGSPEIEPLSRLPWELLFDPERQQYLALSFRTPVLRLGGKRAAGSASTWKEEPQPSWGPGKRKQLLGLVTYREPIPQRLTHVFQQTLQQGVGQGRSLGWCLAEARMELFARSPRTRSWALPNYYPISSNLHSNENASSLNRRWTVFGFLGLFWSALFFIGSRSKIIPGLRTVMSSIVAGFLGVSIGLLLTLPAIGAAIKYCQQAYYLSAAQPLSLQQRIARRLPIPFDIRIQGRRINESTFQFFNFVLLIFVPMLFHWSTYIKLIHHPVWHNDQWPAFTHSRREALTTFIPLSEALSGDFRIGPSRPSDARHRKHLIVDLPWVPFWGTWSFLAILVFASIRYLFLLWKIMEPAREGPTTFPEVSSYLQSVDK